MAMLVKAIPTFLMHVFAPLLGVCLAAWLFVLLVTFLAKQVRPFLPITEAKNAEVRRYLLISLVKEAQRTESKNERPNR